MKITKFILLILVLTILACKQNGEQVKKTDLSKTIESDYYQEAHRPQFHFSPEESWMNDPNGMVYLDGEYHLFYQYYPDSTVWGPMHWAHTVSTDLVHWEHLPIALYPDELGYIFSGSAVIDKNNTAGFGKNAMVAIYTYHDMAGEQSGTSNTYQTQAIAYSTDKGRTFTKYSGNPVIPNPGIKDFRDPKVIWDEKSNQWLMVFAAHDHVKFYGSTNLKEWNHLSDWGKEYGEHGGIWECPDLFPIKVANSNETKWVLLQSMNPSAPNGGSGTQYFVGDFNGTAFTLDPSFKPEVINGKSLWLDYGTDNYAGVSWSNAPVGDDSKLFIGWMSNWQYAQVVPTKKWRSAMTIPRKIQLYEEKGSYRLRSYPLDLVESLQKGSQSLNTATLTNKKTWENLTESGTFHVRLSFDSSKSNSFELKLANQNENLSVGYDTDKNKFFIDRRNSGNTSFEKGFAAIHYSQEIKFEEKLELELFVDRSSIELFALDGQVVMTDIYFSQKAFYRISLQPLSNNILDNVDFTVTELNSIWRKPAK